MPLIGDIGEDALIALFTPRLPTTSAAIVGPGDDAAVLSLQGDLVVSSDVLVQDRHFRREWSTAGDVGYRAAMQNLADIDAMGAVPVALQVTLAAPPSTDVQWVLDFADGLREACEPHDVGVVGGDLAGSREISVSVTAMGDTRGRTPVLRSGARVNNIVAVSGPLGASMAGYHQLENGLSLDSESIDLFLRPEPRIGAGVEACDARATAMMDISDGLVTDLARMARASGIGIAIETVRIPIHPSAQRVAGHVVGNPLEWALTGGEDHHLVATFPQRAGVPNGWVPIGLVTRAHEGLRVDGRVPSRWGWDHFAQK
jgi:thiamine-monophosphate kinase